MSIRHNCKTHGCYIKTQTPDWGFLDNSFSGKIKVSDIDGVVEVKGHLVFLEWKGIGVPTPEGQDIFFMNATRINNITVFLIEGDAQESIVKSIKVYKNGEIVKEVEADNATLKRFCTFWEQQVRDNGFKKVA